MSGGRILKGGLRRERYVLFSFFSKKLYKNNTTPRVNQSLLLPAPLPAPPPSPSENSNLLLAAEAPAALPDGGDGGLPPPPSPFEDEERSALPRGEPRNASS